MPHPPLSHDRLEQVEAWGMASKSSAYVYRPTTIDQLQSILQLARRSGRTVCFQGGGRSYGDAFQNAEEIVVSTSRMTRILDWNPEFGVIDLEPGVTLGALWRYVIEDGWWPPVVSGTMFTTVGGCAAMNIHGKNAYAVGPFGEHIVEFDYLLPSGEVRTVTRESDAELFHAAISGFGMLGCFTRIRLRLKRIYSGWLEVIGRRAANIEDHIDQFEEMENQSDYMVGWADGFPSRQSKVLRGEMHFARYLRPDEDPAPARSIRVKNQDLDELLFGFVPASTVRFMLKPIVNNLGIRALNAGKIFVNSLPGADKPYLQSHAQFAFLLDFIPGWKEAYRPGGLIQFQSFVPKDSAAEVFRAQIAACHRAGTPPYLCVTKKHRADGFLFSHGVDGYSLALDFPVTARNRKALWAVCRSMGELAVAQGGKLYFAKDSTMPRGFHRKYLAPGALERFELLRAKHDPEGLLSSNLYRRVFGIRKKSDAHRLGTADSVSRTA